MERCRELLQVQTGADAPEKTIQTVEGLYEFAGLHGIEIDEIQMKFAESLSIPLPDGMFGVTIDPRKIRSEAERKVKIGHEIGHCMKGAFYNQYAALDLRQKHENTANKWAVQALISESELDQAVADGCTDIFTLAEHFSVTEDFMRLAVCWYTHGNMAVEQYLF